MSVLQKLSDFLVETSEQALKVVEEGSAILMSGGSPHSNDDTGDLNRDTNTNAHDSSDFSGEIPEEYLGNDSPLNGLAEEVLSDIMKNQVRGL